MHIKSIKAKNFFSIGEEPVFVDFTKHGNIILLKGKNYDVDKDEPTSNGSCKSGIFEAIVYALYGKTIRNLSHSDIINKKNKKGLEVELCFDDYKILRTRKPDILRLWKEDKELTLGGIPATQELLENIIKLSYNAFVNIACFGQHNNYDFLSAPPSTKRKIVENILALDKYNKFYEISKEEYKNVSTSIKEQRIHYENLLGNEKSYQNKLTQLTNQESIWNTKKTQELSELEKLLDNKKQQILQTDDGNQILLYENAQIKIKEYSQLLSDAEASKEKCLTAINAIYDKLEIMRGKENDINNHVKTIEASIERNRKEIAKINKDAYMLENLQVGATCSICFGTVAKENYEKVLNHKKEGIKDLENENDSLGIALSGSQATFQGAKNNTQKALAMQVEIKNKVKATEGKILLIKQRIKELISIEKPDTSHQNRLIQEQISSLEDKVFSIKHELNGGNPYKSIIKTIGNELSECQKKLAGISQNIDDATKELTYYNFWIDGFSEDGIRKVLLDDIIPTLNNKIAYYLHFLINDKLKVVFDNNLNEVIERCPPDGDAFAYNATSGGEKKRIDLSISQAFSYIMSISSGTSPSIVMLDEVGAFFDKDGIEGVYRLICELATERQVIVVTHDQVLLDLLENCETITIAKKDGFSTLEE